MAPVFFHPTNRRTSLPEAVYTDLAPTTVSVCNSINKVPGKYYNNADSERFPEAALKTSHSLNKNSNVAPNSNVDDTDLAPTTVSLCHSINKGPWKILSEDPLQILIFT
eukprot:jgi/Psemu1/56043/gm1.56043_g